MAAEVTVFAVFLLITLKSVSGNFDSRCPKSCRCSDDLRQVVCSGQSLFEFPLDLPESVVTLDLSSNYIEAINSTSLEDLRYLEKLDLSSNRISSVPVDAFRWNVNLQHVSLDDNRLAAIPGNSFANSNNVTSLKLARNAIYFIEEADLVHLKALNVLNLAGNKITFVPSFFFKSMSSLLELDLSFNILADTFNLLTEVDHNLHKLGLSHNKITSLYVTATSGFPHLRSLDLSSNVISKVDSLWFTSFTSLLFLDLSRNPIHELSENVFSLCPNVERLTLNELHDLKVINHNAFSGLSELKELELGNNSNLVEIHFQAFSELLKLRVLSLRNNALSFLNADTLSNLSSLIFLDLSGNRWRCDCSSKEFLESLKPMLKKQLHLNSDFVCSQPESLNGRLALDVDAEDLSCKATFAIGSVATLDCPIYQESIVEVQWVTNRLKQYDVVLGLHEESPEPRPTSEIPSLHDRISILNNGSLVINGVARWDGGSFKCLAKGPNGNWSAVVIVQLDYTIVSTVAIWSVIFGFIVAAGFLGIAVLFGGIRRCCFSCSKEELAKRKSIREVLTSIRNGSQMDRFSAYRSAKLDQFSAFRSATMDQLSAFTTGKIGKLRTYKQMTVTNVLQHLERMRQHYSMQTNRIKDNCSQQVERLRENYAAQKEKLKGQRSQQMRKIRENYNSQALKIREYRAQHMLRLREQYKLQQQHLLKLLELLDIGNCVTVIEAECVRTESTIFDADIAFDIEAQSIHVPQDQLSHSSIDLGDISESSSLTGTHVSVEATEEEGFEVPQLDDFLPERFDVENGIIPLDDGFPMDSLFDSLYDIAAEAALGQRIETDDKEIMDKTPRESGKKPGRHSATNVICAQIETSVPPRVLFLGEVGEAEVVVETVL